MLNLINKKKGNTVARYICFGSNHLTLILLQLVLVHYQLALNTDPFAYSTYNAAMMITKTLEAFV